MTDEKPSLRAYIERYAAGEIPRDEALAAIAAWDFDVVWYYTAEQPIQDNSMAVINQARSLGKLSNDDLGEILAKVARRRGGPTDRRPSLRAYIERYAAGEIPRDEALATIGAWDFEEEWFDPTHMAPTHQDNHLGVVNQARGLGRLTPEDIEEIRVLLQRRGF
ncbi:hypothetical protein [Streptomyces sp. NPDC026092]|uniref:hypothetical protein n=1 Tax=Streptomyces sp. NPDC026092 TaxID=3154797 RepID=UPI0033CCF273